MDGMFYQRGVEQSHDAEVDPAPQVGKLLLLTLAFVVAAVSVLVLLSWAGVPVAVPNEFPFP